MKVAFAKMGEAEKVQKVFWLLAKKVGFIMLSQIEELLESGEVLVVEDSVGNYVAATLFHKNRKGSITLYDIASHQKGAGSMLIKEMQSWNNDIKLKVTSDNYEAMQFYKKHGFKEIAVEKGKKRELAVFYWEGRKKKLF